MTERQTEGLRVGATGASQSDAPESAGKRSADKDILEVLAYLETAAEMATDFAEDDGWTEEAQCVTVFRRLAREAGYEIPNAFDWQDHLPGGQP